MDDLESTQERDWGSSEPLANFFFVCVTPDQEGRDGACPPSTALTLECPDTPMTPLSSALKSAQTRGKEALQGLAVGDTRLLMKLPGHQALLQLLGTPGF